MRQFVRQNKIFFFILAIYCLYAIVLILRSSFVIGGTRYFTLFDDEMISMRYARNLAHGFGLVWNPGGEMKYDTAYIAKQRPDLFIQVFPPNEAREYLVAAYQTYYDPLGFLLTVRKDSIKVRRDTLRKVAFTEAWPQ